MTYWDKNPQECLDMFIRKRPEGSRQFIIDLMDDGAYESILECGFGSGDFLDMAKVQLPTNSWKPDISYTGIDFTQAFIDHVQKSHPDARLINGDMQDLSQFGDGEFEVAYTRHTLEHLPYYDKIIPELSRVASKKVVIILFRPLEEDDRVHVRDDGANDNRYGKEGFMNCINMHFSSCHTWHFEPRSHQPDRPEQGFECRPR